MKKKTTNKSTWKATRPEKCPRVKHAGIDYDITFIGRKKKHVLKLITYYLLFGRVTLTFDMIVCNP